VAFKIQNKIVIHDADAGAAVASSSNLDVLQINSIDVLEHSGGPVTLKNVQLHSSIPIDSDTITEGSTNLFHTNARVDARIPTAISSFTNDAGYITTAGEAQALTFSSPNLTISNGNTIDLSSLTTSLAGYATESYADTAEADAITAAATDATTKADAAEADAIASAESKDVVRATAANAYTDTRETAIVTAYQTYANSGDTTTYNAAKSYTDTEIVTGVASAASYTDTAIAALSDSAPGTLDTLNELAAALGDDANYAATTTTAIAARLPLAGGTLTGALTLSGAPSAALHATTKAYVDSAVSTGTGSLDTDDVSEGSNLYFTNARADARIPTVISSFTNDAGYITSFSNTTYTAGTGLNLSGTEFQNTSPDQTVSLTGTGATSISGTYPNFTISSSDTNTDTNTTYTAGNGMTLSGTEFLMSGSYTGSFTATGDVTAYSDARLKTNVTTIENALSKVQSMRGVMFDKVDSLSGETRQSTGVIAQETEKVLPEVVHNNDTGYKSVAYGNIVGVLIEAIKEQQEQINDLKSQIADLK
jgi:hypothetical protein|tara:strand:+ start:487 stop:2097 length:1611 start_codon:yes stop_codon:yes gene_type:complete